jgi:hypothetical protein
MATCHELFGADAEAGKTGRRDIQEELVVYFYTC